MASDLKGDRIVYFVAGVSLVFMMYSIVRHATTLFDSEPPESRNILGMVEDSTSTEAGLHPTYVHTCTLLTAARFS